MRPSAVATATTDYLDATLQATSRPIDARVNRKVFYAAIAASVVVLYLALSVGRSLTDGPGCDEGWFANPAFNLITNGRMATTVLEESNMKMTTGLHQYTYWIMPANILAQAAWYKVVGFGLLSMRSLSVLFGLLALAAWFSIMKSLAGDKRIALLAVALIALDFAFVRTASTGRMDMMSAALNFAAWAVYLRTRERNLTLAILASQAVVVVSGLTHPNGVMGLIGLVFLTLSFDRRDIRPHHFAIAATPYLIGGACYLLYVAQSFPLFFTQLSGNGGWRFWGLANPLGAIKLEMAERYLSLSAGGSSYLKLILVMAYAAGILGAIFTREIRERKGARALLIIAGLLFAYLTFLEGTKLYLYLIHIAPVYSALLALWIHHCWMTRRAPRWIIAPAVCGLLLIHVAGSAYVIARDSYRNSYLPAVSFLNRSAARGASITGSAELGFGLENYNTLLDDKYLGYYNGRKPDFIVVDTRYQEEHDGVERKQPEISEHITRLLTVEYEKVYDRAAYRIYARR
ncbi:MAG TPA: glycosyltransferase family 39 protein [Blastocatellia bacterium]|nr:glycosyltransferase family 39 protein [Blastocatellia bacterium]